MPGVGEILVPGERAARTERIHRRDGIPLTAPVVRDLQRLAESLDVALPASLAAATRVHS